MSSGGWFVYVLRCADQSLYTGIAKNPEQRLAQHRAGKGSRFVRSRLPVKLVYQEESPSRSAALSREAEIKRWSPFQKRALVADFRKKRPRDRIIAMPKNDVSSKTRCPWPAEDPLMIRYHDEEWGVPLFDDRKLFEFLILEGMQAGLSWRCVLHKRENFRKAFAGFDPEKVARFGKPQVTKLLRDAGIIRNRLKIESAIDNAKSFLKLRDRQIPFHRYLWQFVDGKPIINRWTSLKQLPASTPVSDTMSRTLKADGFRFIGSTVCYAHMQATGMVNDHLVTCVRHRECQKKGGLA